MEGGGGKSKENLNLDCGGGKEVKLTKEEWLKKKVGKRVLKEKSFVANSVNS